MESYISPIGKKEAKRIIKNVTLKEEGGNQSSYNVDKDIFKKLVEDGIIYEEENIDNYPDNDNRSLDKKYILKPPYKLKLGPEVINLIGEEYEENEFILSKTKSEGKKGPTIKYQLMNNVYKTLSKENKNYEWFVELFKKNIYGNDLVFEVDKNEELLIIDTIFYPTKGFSVMKEFSSSKILSNIDKPHNRIVFGAPGTGKSFKLEEDREENFRENYERVTFHPNYSYSQFVGVYKPMPKLDDNEKLTGDITYKYVPGPFMRAYIEAHKNPDENFLLLIEEINRADVTSVFGDIFQLLDRKDGESEFEIETSEDMRIFLQEMKEKKIKNEDFNCERIKIPKNMYIWATMNSADQGVFPMDTAFKRRWEFEYIGVNDAVDEDYKKIMVKLSENNEPIHWNQLRTAINNKLSKCKVNEDKLLGPYFISKETLEKASEEFDEENEFIKAFKSKVLMYLFEDAGKHCKDLFDGCKDESKYKFSTILSEFNEHGEKIFGKDILKFADKD